MLEDKISVICEKSDVFYFEYSPVSFLGGKFKILKFALVFGKLLSQQGLFISLNTAVANLCFF